MTTVYCQSHPNVPARWNCTHCNISLCSACVTPNSRYTLCPVCESPMESLGMENVITPFWLRIPKFFLYPAKPAALVYMLILSALCGLVGTGLWQLVIFVVFARYGYAALESTSHGHLDPPEVSVEVVTGEMELPFKQLGVFIVMGAAVAGAAWLMGKFGAVMMLLFAYLCLPASVMELAISRSFGDAINPVRLLDTMRCIGAPYLILWFFLLLLTGGSEAVQYLLPDEMSDFWGFALYSFTNMYFLLAMFHLMGYVIYQYHGVLNHAVEVDFDDTKESKAANVTKPANPVLAQLALLLQEGKIDDARQLLQTNIAQEPGNLDLRQRYHRLLVLAADKKALQEHSEPFITLAMADRKPRLAAEILRDCQRLDPEFRPSNPDFTHPLVQQLRELREPTLAVKLAQNFHRRHPGHADIPALYFLAAKILCEDLKLDQQAGKILHYLVEKFPQHADAKQVRDYLALLDRLAST